MSGDAVVYGLIFTLLAWGFWRAFKIRILGKLTGGRSSVPDRPLDATQASTAALGGILRGWFDLLVKDAVHILIVGETNSGKSTAAKAILSARAARGEQVIILDPHAQPSSWAGLPAIGGGRNYQAIEAALKELQRELDSRFAEYSQNDNYKPTRLNIFIDEIPSIASKCESWQEFFTTLSCEARKVNMSLICLTQSRLVDILGIKGRGDIRDNFVELLLGDKAIKVIPEAAQQTRPAVLDHSGKVSMVDTAQLPALGNRSVEPSVLWEASTTLNADVKQSSKQANMAELPKDRASLYVWLRDMGLDHTFIRENVKGDARVFVELKQKYEAGE